MDVDNKTIIDSYEEYIENLNDEFKPSYIYKGDFVLRQISQLLEEGRKNWIIWEAKDYLEACKVSSQENIFLISEVIRFPNIFTIDKKIKKIFTEEKNISWLNLCHFRDHDGKIHYDSYYDNLPATEQEDTPIMTIGNLRKIICEYIYNNISFEKGQQVYLCDNLKNYNILCDVLVKKELALLNNKLSDQINISAVESRLSSTEPINLYVVTKDVNIVLPMPEDKRLLVYVETEKDTLNGLESQIHHTNCDLLGNRWLTRELSDTTIASSLFITSETVYKRVPLEEYTPNYGNKVYSLC